MVKEKHKIPNTQMQSLALIGEASIENCMVCINLFCAKMLVVIYLIHFAESSKAETLRAMRKYTAQIHI